jgi:hypothetical protein
MKTRTSSKKTRNEDSVKYLIKKAKNKSSLVGGLSDVENSAVSLGDGFNAFDLDFYQIQNLN